MSRWLWWTTWIGLLLFSRSLTAGEPRWASEVVVSKEVRDRVEATPILQRPNRPLHFYGNTVRRIHYRGTAIPNGADVSNALRAAARRPYVPVASQLP